MNNIKDLRDELITAFQDLKDGKINAKNAKELTNLAGKIIMTAKTQLDYDKHLNNKKNINFLNVDEDYKSSN